MKLGNYIKALEDMIAENGNQQWAVGLGNPDSYRGDYSELAFDIVWGTNTQQMLNTAKECVGTTFTGWKGGKYTMTLQTNCWIDRTGGWGRIPLSNKALRLLALIERCV